MHIAINYFQQSQMKSWIFLLAERENWMFQVLSKQEWEKSERLDNIFHEAASKSK